MSFSGFVGKILVEKLLRSCPDVKGIYLLMRPKRGRSGKQRISDLTDSCVWLYKYHETHSYMKLINRRSLNH